MRSLSDLLDRRSDEDFAELKEAFRKAVEANRKSEAQLDAIIRACAVPRDMREGESHRHTSRLERQPLRPNPFFLTTAAVAVLALAFSTAYLLFSNALTQSDAGAQVTEVTARGSPKIVTLRPAAPAGTTEQEEPPGKLEGAAAPIIATAASTATDAAKSGEVAGDAENGPAPSLPRPDVEVAEVTADTGVAIDRPDVKTTADKLEESEGVEPPDQNRNQDMTGALSQIATVQPPAPAGTTEPEEPLGKPEGAVVPSIARGPSRAPGAAGAAGNADDRRDTKSDPSGGRGVEPPDQHRIPTPRARPVNLSLRERDVPKSSPPDAAVSDRAYHEMTRGTLTPNMSAQSEPVTASAKAVTCQTSGPAGDGHWAWRLIDGRKCWYKGAAGTDRSLLHWPPVEGAVVPSITLAPSAATGAAARGDVAGNTENAPAPSLPGSGVEVAKVTADTRDEIDRPDVKTTADKLKESEGVEPPGQNPNPDMAGALSVTCQTSGPAGDGHWAWRLIDGRKCWYKGAAGMNKSLLHWPPLEHVPELQ